ncbi:MAG: transcriptional regulator [Halanaerobiales bacterium]|nr:transcriptional regulator [Halanaerobiales bacterium]
MMLNIEKIGLKIKELRKAHNMTYAEFGLKTGVSGSYISQIEKNKRKPSLEILSRIVDAFDISLAELLNEKEEEFNIGKELKNLRETKNMTIHEIYEKSGVSFFKLGQVENGSDNLTPEEIEKIASALQIKTERLFRGVENNLDRIRELCTSLGLKESSIELVMDFIQNELKK